MVLNDNGSFSSEHTGDGHPPMFVSALMQT